MNVRPEEEPFLIMECVYTLSCVTDMNEEIKRFVLQLSL